MKEFQKSALEVSNEILEILQNLDDGEDAREYCRLHILGMKNAGLPKEICQEALELVKETDSRI